MVNARSEPQVIRYRPLIAIFSSKNCDEWGTVRSG
jgi:hypothetical protein